jgi:D-glucosaminate-6-phosphate ammonia-lyase
MTSIYHQLGVTPCLNAAGTLTRLGGSLMDEVVLSAMCEAASWSVDIADLQSAASQRIAAATGAEAGLVTSGASAALTLAAAACIAGLDIARMARLPTADGMAAEILMHRTHRNAYDHAFRLAGATIIDVGHNDRGTGAGIRGLEAWEIEAAITDRTVALAFSATPETVADLPATIAACHARGLRVIVDAAAQLPPVTNLTAFIAAGADLVVFSGGKAIGGPQGTGILAGTRDLVASALLQQLDMDVSPGRWRAPDFVDRDRVPVPPHHGIGRGFKVGKEDIVGLLVALERFAMRDDAAVAEATKARLAAIAAALPACPSRLVVGRVAVLEIDVADGPATVARLHAGSPPVHVAERHIARGTLIIDLQAIPPERDALLIDALRRAIA